MKARKKALEKLEQEIVLIEEETQTLEKERDAQKGPLDELREEERKLQEQYDLKCQENRRTDEPDDIKDICRLVGEALSLHQKQADEEEEALALFRRGDAVTSDEGKDNETYLEMMETKRIWKDMGMSATIDWDEPLSESDMREFEMYEKGWEEEERKELLRETNPGWEMEEYMAQVPGLNDESEEDLDTESIV